eukprot:gene24503-29800_t
MPPSWTEGVGIAAGITDVPWSDEKDTGYNTAVDWGAAMLAISTVFDLNAALPEESKKRDLGKPDGEGIVYKNMPGFVLLDGVRQTDVRGNTPSASRHLCTTLARSLNKPKLNYRKAVLVKFDKHGPELENVAQYQALESVLEKNVKEFGAKENWTAKKYLRNGEGYV